MFDADSESESDKDRPTEAPIKKKKKKKKVQDEEDEENLLKEKKKKKKDKRREELKPLPAPDTDDEEESVPTPSSLTKEKKTVLKKRFADSDDEEESLPLKKHRKDKERGEGKQKKEKLEEGKKKKGKKERKIETSEDEITAPLADDLSEGPSESQLEDPSSTKVLEKAAAEEKSKQKKGKWEVKLQGIKDFVQDRKTKKPDSTQKEGSLQKLKNLTTKNKEDNAPQSDSSDGLTIHKKSKSKGSESSSVQQKVPSSSTSSSSSSSSVTAAATPKPKEEEMSKDDMLGQKDASGSTNLFEKFLLNCEAKDRAPRRPPPTTEKTSKPTKVQLFSMPFIHLKTCLRFLQTMFLSFYILVNRKN